MAMTSSSGTWLSAMSSKSSELMGPVSVATFFGGSASETKCGSTSYSTLMARMASFDRAFIHRSDADDFVARPENLRAGLLNDLDRFHAGHLLGGTGVDADDLGVRVGAAQNASRQQALRVVVVGIFRAAGGLRWAIDAIDLLAQQRTCRRIGPTVLAHDCFPPDCASATARMPS